MRQTLSLASLSLGLLLAGCQVGGAPCTSAAQCGPNQTCLASGVCAPACQDDTQCLVGEKCSASGGCVPSAGCGANSDCPQGQVCVATACMAGDAGASCGGELFQAARVQANFLVVLDKSGSMQETVGGQTKWAAASQAVRSISQQYGAQMRFGLWMFSSLTRCDPGRQYVAVGDNTSGPISASLPATADGAGTPVGAALQGAQQAAELKDANRANFMLLITDGKENCGGDPQKAVAQAFAKNIKTYVVGFGASGAEIDPARLTAMAVAGGTARNTTPRFYMADNPADLNAALSSIAQGAMACDYKLQKAPPDLAKLYVAVNGQLVPHDPAKVAGWAYDPATQRLALYGPACDLVTQDPAAKVNIVYGCPDPTLIEDPGKGKNDGGTWNWPADAGSKMPNGAACSTAAECQVGICQVGVCGKANNAPCTGSGECASQVCSGGICTPGIN